MLPGFGVLLQALVGVLPRLLKLTTLTLSQNRVSDVGAEARVHGVVPFCRPAWFFSAKFGTVLGLLSLEVLDLKEYCIFRALR